MGWNIAFSSVIGSSHKKSSLPCQDACKCEVIASYNEEDILLAVISDGAGSSIKSQIGSQLAVTSFIEKFSKIIKEEEFFFENCNRDFFLSWIDNLRSSIGELADKESLLSKEYACTLAGCIVGPKSAIFFQIGDGAIVVSESLDKDYGYIFWPQHGEYVNQTNFITQENLEQVIQFEKINKEFTQISLFTDGMERLLLDFQNQIVHGPAFKPIFEWLSLASSNNSEECSKILNVYLDSESINDRTDDDKTLILATRTKKYIEHLCKENS